MAWEVEGFDAREERRFAGIVEAEEEDGVFFFAGGIEIEGSGEVVHFQG